MKHVRHPQDKYLTPPQIGKWVIDHCIENLKRFGGLKAKVIKNIRVFEPGCGEDQPFAGYAADRLGLESVGCDIRNLYAGEKNRCLEDYSEKKRRQFSIGKCTVTPNVDFTNRRRDDSWNPTAEDFDIIATNPPFKNGIEFIERSLTMLKPNGVAAFLLKLNFAGSQSRSKFFQDRPPAEMHILTCRPSFTSGGTDCAQEYAVFIWHGDAIEKKQRRNYGRMCRVHWQDNKTWVLPDGTLPRPKKRGRPHKPWVPLADRPKKLSKREGEQDSDDPVETLREKAARHQKDCEDQRKNGGSK